MHLRLLLLLPLRLLPLKNNFNSGSSRVGRFSHTKPETHVIETVSRLKFVPEYPRIIDTRLVKMYTLYLPLPIELLLPPLSTSMLHPFSYSIDHTQQSRKNHFDRVFFVFMKYLKFSCEYTARIVYLVGPQIWCILQIFRMTQIQWNPANQTVSNGPSSSGSCCMLTKPNAYTFFGVCVCVLLFASVVPREYFTSSNFRLYAE